MSTKTRRPSAAEQRVIVDAVGCPDCGVFGGAWCVAGPWRYETRKLHAARVRAYDEQKGAGR